MNPGFETADLSRFHETELQRESRFLKARVEIIRKVLGDPDPKARVLAIESGYGVTLRAIHEAGYTNVSGLAFAPWKESGAGRFHTDRQEGFPKDLTGPFDRVISFDTLETLELKDQLRLLKEVSSRMAPGGKLLVQVPNATSVIAARRRYDNFFTRSSYTEQSVQFVLGSGGFKVVSLFGSEEFPHARTGSAFQGIYRWAWKKLLASEFREFVKNAVPIGTDIVVLAEAASGEPSKG